MPDSIHLTALELLYRELKRLKISLSNAEKRANVTTDELDNIRSKIDAVDYLIGLVHKEL